MNPHSACGRGKTSINQLVVEAVRMAYASGKTKLRPKIIARNGHGLVVMPKGIRITSADINSALEDM